MLSSAAKRSGRAGFSTGAQVSGSVRTPVMAETAAVSGLTSQTLAEAVPLRPQKLRLKVRKLTASVAGAWPMPMQGPQAHSSTLAPAATIFASAPFDASMVSTCREPGEMTRLTFGATV